MDEKQLNYEFLSIPGESHPGLTFEEYRDACVFLGKALSADGRDVWIGCHS